MVVFPGKDFSNSGMEPYSQINLIPDPKWEGGADRISLGSGSETALTGMVFFIKKISELFLVLSIFVAHGPDSQPYLSSDSVTLRGYW